MAMKTVWLTSLVALLLISSTVAVLARPPVQPKVVSAILQDADAESEFLALLNQEREAAGLRQLALYDDLLDDARAHTIKMVDAGQIFHSTDLTVIATGWQALGENVGYGPTVTKLHNAFMASPSHRANIMGNYDRVGIAVENDGNGVIYVTVMFMRSLDPPPIPGTEPEPEPISAAAHAVELGIAGALSLGAR